MNKNEIIEYLNKIKPFINLTAICKLYNEQTLDIIDYNNLRVVLNGKSETRLSEIKLKNFLKFVYKFLYVKIFDIYNVNFFVDKENIEFILQKHFNNISNEIIGELGAKFPNK